MLSDLPLSNEFLSQKIIAIDNTTKKRKWEDSGNFTHCESSIMSPSNRAGIKQLESQGGPYKSLYGSSDQLIIIGDGDATADNGFYDLSGKLLRGRPFVNVNHSAELCGNEQLVSGNRDELTTPVTLTTLDNASILDDNYLYGHIDELGQLMSSGCYPVELSITPPPNAQPTSCSTCLADHCIRHYSNQDADHLDPYTTGFPCAAPVHSNQTYNENPIHTVNPYYCKEQSAEMGSGVAHALPFTWMSGTDGGESLQCHLSDTNDLFATLHSSDCASQLASTLSTNESDVRETPMDEVCTSCELNESVTYMGQQRKDESITKVDSYSMDAQEGLRRDRLTGKFKQSTHSKQPTSSEKFCKVCGDRAVNHNFGQLTCESCKAFFRRNAHKELTCTSKTGEHEITPATRRECPACRLKKCFMVGMRPDLIQVRKKDGSKPRWLDKVPSAAIVHEKHCTQATELATKSCLPFEAKQKHSAAEFGPSKHVRECCDDVCSTDSGSCISINTSAVTAMLVDNVTGSLGGNGPTVERLDGDETVWSAKHAIPNPQIQLPIAVTEASDFPQLHHPNVDLSKRLADSQLATCQIHLDQIDYEATLEETKDKLLASETLVPLSEKCTPTANCTEAANTSCSQAFTGETESFQPMCIAKTLETGPCFQKDPALASSVNSAETRMLRTADDFILLTNTPRLIVPTNLVTIQPTTLVTPNQLPVPSAPNLQSTSTNFGLQVSHLDLAHPSTSPPVRYAAYATLPPEQTVHTGLEPKGALVGNPKQLDGESAITPLWSPVSSTTISSSVLRIANSMQTMVPDLTTSLPTCVLTNSIQHLAPITAISVQGVTPMNLPDCSSVCISGTTLPISVNSASSKPAIVHARTMTTPAQPTLVFHNPAESRILLTQPSSYIGVLSHPLNWPSLTLASDETQQPNLRQTNSNWTGLKSSTPFSSEIEQSSTAHWQQLRATDHGKSH
ncbi:unnamed protein product [Dicrocoelium dendriticum]|nr:unnamed protein product [Dicrocoelium dendriticum]